MSFMWWMDKLLYNTYNEGGTHNEKERTTHSHNLDESKKCINIMLTMMGVSFKR